MKRLLMTALLLAVPMLAQAQNTGLERLTRPDQITSWKAVGRVDMGGKGYCTGTLIAKDLVLTAAHCLFGPDGAPVDIAQITFRSGLADGVAVAQSPVLRAVAHEGYRSSAGGQQRMEQIRHDVALLQLAAPIEVTLAPPFAVASPVDGEKVSVVSYARGRDDALSWQRACTVLGRRQGLIAVDCDVTFGSSGAPVFDRSQGRARIVSIISAGTGSGKETVAFGMELPRLISEMKAQFRAGRGVFEAEVPPAVSALPQVRSPGTHARNIADGLGGVSARGAGGARFVKAPGN